MADDITNNLDEINEGADEASQSLARTAEAFKAMGISMADVYAINQKQEKILKARLQNEKKALDLAIKIAQADGKESKGKLKSLELQKKQIGQYEDFSKQISDTTAQIKRLTRAQEAGSDARRLEIKKLEAEGKNVKAFFAKMKDGIQSLKNADGSFNKGKVAAGVVDAASNPKAIIGKMGVWGVLIEMIVDTIDGVRKMKGQMMEASAASGQFGKSMNIAKLEANALAKSQAEFAMQGLDVAQVADVYRELKETGIASLGVVNRIPGALSKSAKAAIAFSKASGESSKEVAERFASLQRNFGATQGTYEAQYSKILASAQRAAEDGVTTTSGYMQTVMSLGMAFTDVGVSISGVNSIVASVGKSMKELGRPMANLQKVASGILGITKASEGWQVFMARMSGMQGGYAQTLFKQQQRGPGGALPKAGEMDPMQYVKAAKNMLLKPTAGIADQSTRQLMIERLGSQMGMDAETTQIFQKMASGNIGTEEAGADMEKLWKEAKEANMSQKGMFDIIKNILMGLIAKPILWIYELMQKIFGSIDEGAADERIAEIMGGPESNDVARGSTPRYVQNAGMMRVHADEIIGGKRALENAKTTPYAPGAGMASGGGGGNNFNFTMQIDANSLSRSFKQMESMTYRAIVDQQRRNYVG